MRIRRILSGILSAALLLGLFCCGAPTALAAEGDTVGYTLPEGTVVYADSALLVNLGSDIDRDVVLYAKAADEVRAPGAMMRFMVVAYTLHRLEQTGMDIDAVTGAYTVEMFNNYVAGTGVPTANMQFGETWTLRDLLAISFIQNASDAVTVLACTLDGSVQAFIEGMNALADEIGCDYTHFSNLTGLDSLGQYTTPRDMYRIIRYAQRFSVFEDIVGNRQYTVKPIAGGTERTMWSVNSMQQSSSPFYYSPLAFSRTGLSEHEGRTCASVARDSGYEYLVVVMSCPEQNEAGESGLHYRDTRTLFRWAFNKFEHATVLAKSEILASVKVRLAWNTDRVNLVPAKEFSTVVENSLDPDQIIKKVTVYEKEIEAPVQKGTVLGKVELIVNVDEKIGEIPLVAAESMQSNLLLVILSGIGAVLSSGWLWLAVGVVALVLGGYVAFAVLDARRHQNRVRNRKRGR